MGTSKKVVDKNDKITYIKHRKAGGEVLLSKFKVSNFLSFDDEQTFSMEAGKVRSHIDRIYTDNNAKLLKFMAIYGANASGKSNLVSAFNFAQMAIIEGIPTRAYVYYCKLNRENKMKSSRFEFTIILDHHKYVYGFDVVISSGSFVSEYLKLIKYGNTYKTIFSRNVLSGEYVVDEYFKSAAINERLKIYIEDIKSDSSILFLRMMNQNKESLYEAESEIIIYKQIFNWIKYNLSVNYPDRPITNYSYLIDGSGVEQVGKLLSAFGTGVAEFSVADIPLEKATIKIPNEIMEDIVENLTEQQKRYEKHGIQKIPAIMLRSAEDNSMFIIQLMDNNVQCKTLEFRHQATDAIFSIDEESDGTIRLLDLIEVLLSEDTGKVYIIDEINRRFHPLLTYKFVEEYLRLATERNIQLIVTTHESKLMDFDLLRKDEIGFVDKDEEGKSTIFSLDSFGERFDKKVCKAYLKGTYGAIPKFLLK